MISTFQLNLMKRIAQSDPYRHLADAVQVSEKETNRIIASGRMKEINTGFEDGDIEVEWNPAKECFAYNYTWGEVTLVL